MSPAATVTTVAGTANIAGTEDGTGSAAHFNCPTQIATDGTSLYVADSGNSAIRRITLADFKVKTIGGQAGTAGKTEGGPTEVAVQRSARSRGGQESDLRCRHRQRRDPQDRYQHRSRPARLPAPAKKATRTVPRYRRSSTIPARSAPMDRFCTSSTPTIMRFARWTSTPTP